MTFSIIGMSAATGEIGISVASCIPAVGAVVPWGRAGVGAVASQGLLNKAMGPRALSLMIDGWSAELTLNEVVRRDRMADQRQLAIMGAMGKVAQHTGAKTLAWSGHLSGQEGDLAWAAQGNILAGSQVLEKMVEAFVLGSEPTRDFSSRVISALEAGDRAGGDRRGKQSAALLVLHPSLPDAPHFDRLVDLRVDDHLEPVAELRRIYELCRREANNGG